MVTNQKKVGLFGSVGFIVGCVIGAGIFVMTGPLAGEVGPGLYIGYIIALIPAIGQGFSYAQLGSAIQTTSSAYSYMSMFFHPILGFASAWVGILTGAAILALLAEGFAEYFCVFFPSLNPRIVSYGVLVLFYLLHLIGIKSAELVQSLMVVFMVGVLAIFVVGGIPATKPELAQPLFPHGWTPLLGAASSLFFAYLGFNTITDIGEEVDNPGKTIPLSIIISAIIVGFLYIGTSYVLPRIIPWEELATTKASLAEAATLFLPSWGRGMILWAAVLAVATTINSSIMMNSRAWYAMARDNWLPKNLTNTLANGAPYVALTCSLISGIIILATRWGVVYCGTMGSINSLLQTMLIAWAPVMLPNRFPEEYQKAPFKIPRGFLYVLATVTSVLCAVLTISGFISFPSIVLAFVVWLIPGLILYKTRKKVLSNS